jgi:hypothetical protein
MGDGGNRNACSGVHGRYSLVTWASRSNQPPPVHPCRRRRGLLPGELEGSGCAPLE